MLDGVDRVSLGVVDRVPLGVVDRVPLRVVDRVPLRVGDRVPLGFVDLQTGLVLEMTLRVACSLEMRRRSVSHLHRCIMRIYVNWLE